jgi:hypothetical protein
MILVDTSIWVDHFRHGDRELSGLLQRGEVLSHPFVIGELSLGHLQKRAMILGDLDLLPSAVVASDSEIRGFIEAHRLYGLGVGLVDAHLLGAVRLTAGSALWTRDKRLLDAAKSIQIDVH